MTLRQSIAVLVSIALALGPLSGSVWMPCGFGPDACCATDLADHAQADSVISSCPLCVYEAPPAEPDNDGPPSEPHNPLGMACCGMAPVIDWETTEGLHFAESELTEPPFIGFDLTSIDLVLDPPPPRVIV
ncbi:MAG: hypothetical protein AAGI17_06840 [Planctomycetota bacterium]